MRIVLLVRSLAVGGAERQLVQLAHGLASTHEISVVTFYDEPRVALDGCALYSLAKRGRWDLVGFAWRLLRLLGRLRPQVIYAFLPTATLMSLLARIRDRRIVLVWGIRATRMDYSRYDRVSALARRAETYLARWANLLIANSSAGRRDAIDEGVAPGRIIVIENGIDTLRFKPAAESRAMVRRRVGLPATSFLIGCVARIDPMKGHPVLLEAAAQYLKCNSDAHLLCVGDGPAEARVTLLAQARRLGIASRVHWVGAETNVEAYFQAMDIHTSASLFGEGFSNALAEAMACGIPCVATAVGDAHVILGETGEIVAPGSVPALVAGWQRLSARIGNDRGATLAAQARSRICVHFGVDRMVQRTECALRGAVEGARA